jgi:predicted ester cyclase
LTRGEDAVRGLLDTVFMAFPDFEFVAERSHHADDAVVVEGRITGTQHGEWAGVAPTGRGVDVPTCCIYHFDADRLTSESVYFDHATLLGQWGHTAAPNARATDDTPRSSAGSGSRSR